MKHTPIAASLLGALLLGALLTACGESAAAPAGDDIVPGDTVQQTEETEAAYLLLLWLSCF